MDFTGVTAALTSAMTANSAAVVGILGISLGTGFVFRLIRRAAK